MEPKLLMNLLQMRLQELAKKTSVLPPLPSDRFLCGFAHIFADSYSAGPRFHLS